MVEGSISRAWQWYVGKLERDPLRTKALTSSTVAALSDVMAQRLQRVDKVNSGRTIAMAILGLLWGGPSLHLWQGFMERMFGGKDLSKVVQKVLIDQVTYGPVNNIVMIAYISLIVDRATLQATFSRVKARYPSVQIRAWQVWPLVSLINYRFVPLTHRVLFANIVALCWSTYLILQARQKTKKLH